MGLHYYGLAKRRCGSRSWVLWRGGFLRYCTEGESELRDRTDQWACERVEAIGLSPTVKPGKTEYNRLNQMHTSTQRKLNSMTTGSKRLFWTPPLNVDNDALATILNGMNDAPYVVPSDASLMMASHIEQCELIAEQNGLEFIRCELPATLLLIMIHAIGGEISIANIERCLQAWNRHAA